MRNHTSTFLEWLPDKTMLHRECEACKIDLGFRIGSSSESWSMERGVRLLKPMSRLFDHHSLTLRWERAAVRHLVSAKGNRSLPPLKDALCDDECHCYLVRPESRLRPRILRRRRTSP